ncbi:MAG: hypothetical protein NC821_02505, partial [Candidatus Omnitrophica bacterium]|nr:hypothetical protein [Candidatus Omnitrophota bacterium]
MSKKKGRRIKIKKKIIPDFITKIIFRFFLLGLVFSLLALGGRKLAYLFLTNLSYFNLSEVYIKNHYYLEGEEAFAFTRLKPGINIFSLNLSSLAKEIKER